MIIKRAHADIKHKPFPNGEPATTQRYLSHETAVHNVQEVSVVHLLAKGSIDGQGQENGEHILFILAGVGIVRCVSQKFFYEPRDLFMVDPGESYRIENTGDSPVSMLIIRMKIGAHDQHE